METVMEDDNLLEEILLHLPAETVHGCKPVSKHWCSLISSLRFRRRHATYHLHLPTSSSNIKIFMIDQKKGTTTTLLDISNGVTVIKTSKIESSRLLSSIEPFYQKIQKLAKKSEKIELRVHDAYNGLLILSLERKREREYGNFDFGLRDQKKINYVVCNPLTKEYHKIPITRKQKEIMCFASPFPELAFAPSESCCGSYKLILVSLKLPRRDIAKYILKVYSSETCTWKDLGNLSFKSLYESKSMVWDNCLFVVPQSRRWSSNRVDVLDSERLRLLRSSSLLPSITTIKDPKTFNWVAYMGESGGVLYVIVEEGKFYSDNREMQYTLWEMKGIDGAWREKFQFKTDKEPIIVYIHREGEHVRLLFWLESTATFYYCLNGNIESMQEAGDLLDMYYEQNIRSYTPTLFPLGG